MNTWFKQRVEEEYIRLLLLADQLLGKEKLVDFYYGSFTPQREEAPLIISDIIFNLEELLNTTKKQLDDNPPFYLKTVFTQQISSFKTYLENEISDDPADYQKKIEAVLGVKLVKPNWQKHQQALENSLQTAGYSGSVKEMLNQWQQEGMIDIFGFMQEAEKQLSLLWEEVNTNFLPLLLSDEEIDFLQNRSEIKFCYLDNIWEDWPYYGGYRNNYMTMIALNARLNWNRFEIKTILAHEALPGRHLFWSLRQRLHTLEQLPEMNMLCTLVSPEKLVQEGLIACANEFLWPDGFQNPKEQIALNHWRLRHAVGLMATIKLYSDNDPKKDIQRFIEKEASLSPGRAKAMLQIIQEFPYHYPAAQLGYELVSGLAQTFGEDFWLDLPYYRCPRLLKQLYAMPTSKKGEDKVV